MTTASDQDQVLHLDGESFPDATAEGVTLVDFYADWCGPCRMLAPALEQLAADLAGRARVAKVNVDGSPELAARFGVSAIPLLVILKDGQEVKRLVGLPSAAALKAAVLSAGRV